MSSDALDAADDSFLDAGDPLHEFLSESEGRPPSIGNRGQSPEPYDSDDAASFTGLETPVSPPSATTKQISFSLFPPGTLLGDLADELAGDDAPLPAGRGVEERLERISNFFQVPEQIERIVFFGFFICLDSLLYIFTILPLRVLRHLVRLARNVFWWRKPVVLLPQQRSDLIKAAIIILVSRMLQEIDTSVVYHTVRGQSVVKLYVIFNVLEILDKLCSSFGNDILDSLYLNTRETTRNRAGIVFRSWWRFIVACVYVWIHTLVFFGQCTSLQVAINSYNNALLTLLLSNQFVEVKGAVFKKYERENLFQLVCADIVERFQLTVFLFIVGARNYLELSGADDFSADGGAASPVSLLSNLRGIIRSLPEVSVNALPLLVKVIWPLVLIMGSEVLVDWLKHAFVTKFNAMEPARLYTSFGDKLATEIVSDTNHNRQLGESVSPGGSYTARQLVDHAPALSKRIGFSVLPLACLIIRVAFQIAGFLGVFDPSSAETGEAPLVLEHGLWWAKLAAFGTLVWTGLLVLKLHLSRALLAYAANRVKNIDMNGEKMIRYPDAHVFPAPLAKSNRSSP